MRPNRLTKHLSRGGQRLPHLIGVRFPPTSGTLNIGEQKCHYPRRGSHRRSGHPRRMPDRTQSHLEHRGNTAWDVDIRGRAVRTMGRCQHGRQISSRSRAMDHPSGRGCWQQPRGADCDFDRTPAGTAVQLRRVAGARRAIPRRIRGARLAITSTARSERRITVRRPGVGIDASSASGDPARGP
jgi:hypothetical protein